MGELKLATSTDFELFYFEKGGQLVGFEIELGELLAVQMKLKPVWVKGKFSTLLNSFETRS